MTSEPKNLDDAAAKPKATEKAPERVTVVYRGPNDRLLLADGTELQRNAEAEAARTAVEEARAAGHHIE